jgi:post-segregation antitoxin (ccd killing protein)
MGQIVSRKLKSGRGHEPQREQERQWRENHADFIAAYNSTIAAEGLPLDEWKSF